MQLRPQMFLSPLSHRHEDNSFLIGNKSLSEILSSHDTPLYVTSLQAVRERVQAYQKCLNKYVPQFEVFYAVKANYAQEVLKCVRSCQAGADIVSIGEWRAALQAGFNPEKICFAGAGKKPSEWMETILQGIGYINVEHVDELEDILNFIFQNKEKIPRIPCISLRLNPCLDIETHPHLRTGALDSKFGILFEHFQQWLIEKKADFRNHNKFVCWLEPLSGLHVHLGSQLLSTDIFAFTIQKVLDCAQFMLQEKIKIKHLDLGGGLGVPVNGVPLDHSDISAHVELLCGHLKKNLVKYPELLSLWHGDLSELHVSLEPGRSIVASSTVFLTKVLYTKINSLDIRFCYVDGAMNDFPRPSIYDAVHHVELVKTIETKPHVEEEQKYWRVVGPVCESGDFLSKKALLPDLKKGDILAFFEAGAYCRSMASEYNLRPLTKECFI